MDWILFLVFFAACAAAGSTGAMFSPGDWYRNLAKPSWTPPDWLFPVAWSILYVCIAASAALVAPLEGSALALAFWALQIALNTLWSPVFFGLKKMKAGMIVLSLLWLAVAATLWTFLALDMLAGLLIAPYLLWVTVAGALNWSVLRLNPAPRPA